MSGLRSLLALPTLSGVDMDGEARLLRHREILERKPVLRALFAESQAQLFALAGRFLSAPGISVELGAGVVPMREIHPEVIATDIVRGRHLDVVLDAQRMPFPADSVRVVHAQNAFHHFPEPARFFGELERVLAPGGGAVLLEPAYGPVATLLYRRLFRTEGFDKAAPQWETPSTGPMRGANQALSYIVFVRDRAQFEQRFPGLEIVHREPVGHFLRYLVSGGLNFRQLLPDFMFPLLRGIERGLAPFRSALALHHVIVLRKRAS